jgi:uncharacterized protein YodC (DUF2158 family)
MKRLIVTLFIIIPLFFLTGCPIENYNTPEDWPDDAAFYLGDVVTLKVAENKMVIVAYSVNSNKYKCSYQNSLGGSTYDYFSPYELELVEEDS